MANLKDVQTKIGGVKKTSQITSAMNMVAAAKLRGAQQKMEDFHDYAEKFNGAMGNLSPSMNPAEFPLMEQREVKTVELIVVTSDRGLCGSFNSHVVKKTEQLIAQYKQEGKKVSILCVGKKGNSLLKKTGLVRNQYLDLMGTFQMFNARAIGQDAADNFLSGAADEVKIVSSEFISVAVQKPKVVDLLPIKPIEVEGERAEEAGVDYIYEPQPEQIMEVLLPLYLNVMVFNTMLEVAAGEHAARMSAMDNATSACRDMISELTMIYNKVRQGSITADLMDIVGGAEALKG